jgi:hypothetical protein
MQITRHADEVARKNRAALDNFHEWIEAREQHERNYWREVHHEFETRQRDTQVK